MLDDSTESHVLKQQEYALADCKMTGDSGVPQVINANPLPNIGSHLDSYLDTIKFQTRVVSTAYTTPLDVTDGSWNTLSLGLIKATNSTSVNVSNFTNFGMEYLMGIRPIDETDNSTRQYSSHQLRFYNWFKLNGFRIKLRNFCVTVERDNSGGVQLLDEPVFMTRLKYAINTLQSFTGTEFSPTVTQTDLQKGFEFYVPVKINGWIHNTAIVNIQGGAYVYR